MAMRLRRRSTTWYPTETPSIAAVLPCLQTGGVLGDRYVVVNYITRGGYGRIYRAYDTVDHVLVAVKVWVNNTDGANERTIELETLALLRGANGCSQLLDQVDLPEPYRVAAIMPLGGKTVAHIEDPTDQYNAFCSACRALYNCHMAGVVHRDIKPEQILFPTKFQLSKAVEKWFSEHVDPLEGGVEAKGSYVRRHFSEIPTPPRNDPMVYSDAMLIDARGWRHPAMPNIGFKAPEALIAGLYMPESDWWALGSTMLAWLDPDGESPFETDEDSEVVQMQIILYAMRRENTGIEAMRGTFMDIHEMQPLPNLTPLDRFRGFNMILRTADPLKPGMAQRIQYHKIAPRLRKMLKHTLAINPFRRRAFNVFPSD